MCRLRTLISLSVITYSICVSWLSEPVQLLYQQIIILFIQRVFGCLQCFLGELHHITLTKRYDHPVVKLFLFRCCLECLYDIFMDPGVIFLIIEKFTELIDSSQISLQVLHTDWTKPFLCFSFRENIALIKLYSLPDQE